MLHHALADCALIPNQRKSSKVFSSKVKYLPIIPSLSPHFPQLTHILLISFQQRRRPYQSKFFSILIGLRRAGTASPGPRRF
jgi:hypothetical protein